MSNARRCIRKKIGPDQMNTESCVSQVGKGGGLCLSRGRDRDREERNRNLVQEEEGYTGRQERAAAAPGGLFPHQREPGHGSATLSGGGSFGTSGVIAWVR